MIWYFQPDYQKLWRLKVHFYMFLIHNVYVLQIFVGLCLSKVTKQPVHILRYQAKSLDCWTGKITKKMFFKLFRFFLQMNKLKTFSTSVCYILAIGTSAVWRPTLENVSFSHKKNVLYLHISVYVQESVYIFISNLQTLLYEFLGKLSCGWIWRYCLINTRSLKKVIKQRSPWKNVKGWGSWI